MDDIRYLLFRDDNEYHACIAAWQKFTRENNHKSVYTGAGSTLKRTTALSNVHYYLYLLIINKNPDTAFTVDGIKNAHAALKSISGDAREYIKLVNRTKPTDFPLPRVYGLFKDISAFILPFGDSLTFEQLGNIESSLD